MPIVQANGLPYHVEIAGEGPPLLLLHGFTGSSENWARHRPLFARHYQTITVDILGHGRSASPADAGRYTMAHCAQDIATLLEQVARPPAHLLGYSMGGRLALYLALTRSELFRSLILESTSPGLATAAERAERIARDQALADSIEADGIEPFVARWEQIPLFASQQRLPDRARAVLRQQRLRNNPRGLANSLRGMGTGAQPSLWESLPQLALPLLLIVGEWDDKFSALARQMAGLVPAALTLIPEAGHTVHLEQPVRFQEAVLAFLAEVDREKQSTGGNNADAPPDAG